MSEQFQQPPDQPPQPPSADQLAAAEAKNFKLKLENELLRRGVSGTHLDDSVELLMARASRGPDGRIGLGDVPLDATLDGYVHARPHLIVKGPPNEHLRTAARAGWNPERVAEPQYGAEWKKADPKGYAEAFAAHMNKVMANNGMRSTHHGEPRRVM